MHIFFPEKSDLYEKLSKNMSTDEKLDLIRAIRVFPASNLESILEFYIFFSKKMNSRKRFELAKIIIDFPLTNLETKISVSISLFKNRNANEAFYLARAIIAFPGKDFETRVKIYKNLSKKIADQSKLDLLHLIKDFPAKSLQVRKNLCKQLSRDMDANEVICLAHAIKSFSSEKIEERAKIYKNFSKNIPNRKKFILIDLIHAFPSRNLEIKRKISKKFSKDMKINEIFYLLHFVKDLPLPDIELRTKIYKKLSRNMNANARLHISWVMKVLPIKENVIKALQEMDFSKENSIDILNRLFALKEIQRDIFHYWKMVLDSSNEENAKTLAECLSKKIFFFKGDLEYIQQRVFEIKSLSENDSQNPYKVYVKHLSSRKEPIQIPSFQYWNIPAFQDIALEETLYAKDLPANVSMESIKKIYKDLKKRLQNNPLLHQKINLILGEFENNEEEISTISHIENAWNSFFSREIQLLLERNAEESIVPVEQAKLFSIFHYIQSLNSHTKNDELNRKEECFLQALSMIRTCNIGKKEGINRFYLDLQEEFSFSSIRKECFIKDFIRKNLKIEIERKLSSDSAFIEEITPLEQITELPHQSLYVKNLLSSFLGFPIKFDPYTFMIRDSIFELTPKQALEKIFISLLKDRKMILKRLKDSINEKLSNEKSFYSEIMLFFERFQLEISGDFFEVNCSEEKIKITKKGVYKLLELSNFVIAQ